MIKKDNGFVYVNNLGGHRREYLTLFVNEIGLQPNTGSIFRAKTFITLIYAKKLLFATLDDDFIGFVFIAIARSILGKRTFALLLRPQSCFLKSKNSTLKFNLLKILLKSEKIKIFTIINHLVDPRYSLISNGSIYDPQMWDKYEILQPPNTFLSDEITKKSNGKDILIFIGSIHSGKGINYFLDLMLCGDLRNIFFVAVGPITDKSISVKAKKIQSNGLILDYYPTDIEISSLYGVSKFVWCCYSEEYDQASGIFGRAVQYKRIPLVRKGSILAKIAATENISVIEIDINNIHKINLSKINNFFIEKDKILSWRNYSIDNIKKCL